MVNSLSFSSFQIRLQFENCIGFNLINDQVGPSLVSKTSLLIPCYPQNKKALFLQQFMGKFNLLQEKIKVKLTSDLDLRF